MDRLSLVRSTRRELRERCLDIALALLAALLFALGTVLQQRAGMEAPSIGPHSGLVLRMARRPVWLAGFAIDCLGFAAQAAALGNGRLAVVQPLLISSLVFALPLGVLLTGQRIGGPEVAAALLVVAALTGLLLLADPAGGRSEARLSEWLIAGAACVATCAPLTLLSRRAPPDRRSALLAAGAGILFALSAALTKASVDELHLGFVHLVSSWEPYALAIVGYGSLTLNQLALDTGELAAAVATGTAVDPVVSVVLGLALFHEALHAGGVHTAGTLVSLVLALLGMAVLARSENETPGAAG